MSCPNPTGPFVVADGVRGSNVGMDIVVEPNSASTADATEYVQAPDQADQGLGASVGSYTTGMGSTIV